MVLTLAKHFISLNAFLCLIYAELFVTFFVNVFLFSRSTILHCQTCYHSLDIVFDSMSKILENFAAYNWIHRMFILENCGRP